MGTAADRQVVDIGGRRMVLSNLDRLLFPASGQTKAHLLHYYAQVAPAMVPHTADRPASFVRAPDGPEGQMWFAKNPPPGAPYWLTTADVPGSEGPAPHVVVDSPQALLAMANLGAFEVHVPQWRVPGGPGQHDRLVLDLDPGEGADLTLCCQVARLLRDILQDEGLTPYPVVSGGKGLHLYVPLVPAPARAVNDYAKGLARRMLAAHPETVVATMARSARAGKVFIDWSQNSSAKTTAAPYTLRVRPHPSVAAPVRWDEIEACRDPRELAFTPDRMLRRLAEDGDLLAGLADPAQTADLPT